jgi:hypothetical protein
MMANEMTHVATHAQKDDTFILKAWGWWKIAWTVLKNIIYIFLILPSRVNFSGSELVSHGTRALSS